MPTPPLTPTPVTSPRLSYGNIYTPHAGSMIIQVQRESGLQSRTIVLSSRQVRILNFFASRSGKIIAACLGAIAVILVVEAIRVPGLTYRISRMEHTAQRLDSLERSLSEVQKRYDQVRTMMGVETGVATHGAHAPVAFAPAPTSPASAATGQVASGGVSAGADQAGGTDADVVSPGDTAENGSPPGGAGAAGVPVAARRRRGHRAHAPVVPVEVAPVQPTEAPPADSGVTPSPQAEPQ